MTALLVPSIAYGGNPPSIDLVAPRADGCLQDSICPPGNWVLSVDDEFNGSSLDRTIWSNTPGDGAALDGQACSDNSEAVSVSSGLLTIRAFPPSHCKNPNPPGANGACAGPVCTGGEITTAAIYGPGYYDARMKSSASEYSVFWLEGMGNDCASIQGGFEADIAESWGGNSYQNNIHWSGYRSCAQSVSNNAMGAISDTFHVIGLLWDANGGLTFYHDGQETYHLPGPVGTHPTDIRFADFGATDSQPAFASRLVPLLYSAVNNPESDTTI